MRGSSLAIRLARIAGIVAMMAWPGSAPGTEAVTAWPPAARDSLQRSALPADVWSARDSIHRMLTFHRGMTVRRASGSFEDPWGGRLTTCRLMIHGTFRDKPPYDDAIKLLEQYFERAGWKSDEECSADGPDGTVWGVRRGGVRCLVEGRWEGGDDSDTTAVPSPEYDVTVDCLPDRKDICPH